MKQALLEAHAPEKMGKLWTKNLPLIEWIADEHPNLVSADGQHYVEFLRNCTNYVSRACPPRAIQVRIIMKTKTPRG